MEEKLVILQRKQSTDFTINFPYGDRGNKEYAFMGSKGARISERGVPMDVFEWIKQETNTFQMGCLVIKPTEDEDVNYARESIEDIEEAESSALLKQDVVTILTTGNQNVLKKALKTLTENKSEELVKSIHRQVIAIAGELSIDSVAKRKVICEWAGIDFDMAGDILFEKAE